MDFDLSSEQQEIRKLAQEFAGREIAPGARERDRNQTFPKDVLEKMAPLGLLGGPIPEKYGGIGIDYVSHALVTEEIGRADVQDLPLVRGHGLYLLVLETSHLHQVPHALHQKHLEVARVVVHQHCDVVAESQSRVPEQLRALIRAVVELLVGDGLARRRHDHGGLVGRDLRPVPRVHVRKT